MFILIWKVSIDVLIGRMPLSLKQIGLLSLIKGILLDENNSTHYDISIGLFHLILDKITEYSSIHYYIDSIQISFYCLYEYAMKLSISNVSTLFSRGFNTYYLCPLSFLMYWFCLKKVEYLFSKSSFFSSLELFRCHQLPVLHSFLSVYQF